MKNQLYLTVIVGALENLIYSGSVYGWANLQPILVTEGYFSASCPTNTSSDELCDTQVEQLNLVFSIFSSAPPILLVGFGYFIDRYGNWVTRTTSLLVYAAGLLITAFSTPATSWLLYLSFSMLSLAGLGMLFASITLGNLVPYYRSSVVTLMNGAFDTGSLTFLVISTLYKGGIGFSTMLYFYAGFLSLFAVQTFFLTPRRTAPFVLPKNFVYGYKELSCFKEKEDLQINNDTDDSYKELEHLKEEVDKEENPDNQTLKDCFMEIFTWTEFIHYCVLHFSVTRFIGSFNTWIVTKVDKDSIDMYTTAFGIIQGLGIFFAPFSGLLIDYCRRRYSKKIGSRLGSIKSVTVLLFINDFLVISMFTIGLIPNAEVQFLTMILQVVSRAFVYSTAAAFTNAIYPTQHFGIMFGVTKAWGGLASCLQYPVTLLLTRVLDNNFVIVQGFLLGLSVINLLHPLYLLRLVNKRAAKRVAEQQIRNTHL